MKQLAVPLQADPGKGQCQISTFLKREDNEGKDRNVDGDNDRDRETTAEFRDVTEAYLDVEREMRSRDSRRDRLASDHD